MMNNRTYFVFAVIIALIVPLMIATIYFVNLYQNNGPTKYISKLADNRELLILGATDIGEIKAISLADKDYLAGNVNEFVVKYASGNDDVVDYTIRLKDIVTSAELDPKHLKWRLCIYDANEETFVPLSMGSLETIEDSSVTISPSVNIALGDIQKYRLYYYLSYEEVIYRNVTFKAKIALE